MYVETKNTKYVTVVYNRVSAGDDLYSPTCNRCNGQTTSTKCERENVTYHSFACARASVTTDTDPPSLVAASFRDEKRRVRGGQGTDVFSTEQKPFSLCRPWRMSARRHRAAKRNGRSTTQRNAAVAQPQRSTPNNLPPRTAFLRVTYKSVVRR